MDEKMTRREALKGLFFAGMGLAAGGSILKGLGTPANAATPPKAPWTEAPDGSKNNPYTIDGHNHPGMFNYKGYISFCGHGAGLKIRNVRILDLGYKK